MGEAGLLEVEIADDQADRHEDEDVDKHSRLLTAAMRRGR